MVILAQINFRDALSFSILGERGRSLVFRKKSQR